jgi:hypothetical protein
VTSLLNLYVLPPFAVARLGASDTPVDAFDWVENPATHGAGKTVIRPAVSLRVLPDGSIQPYMPSVILFRDGPGQKIRPTAPFFELWARFDDAADPQPLTETRLEQIGSSLARVSWRVRAANLKAARRTKSPADGFGAEVTLRANEHAPVPLLAVSPNVPEAAPLVMAIAPILLGRVQAIRPYPGTQLGVDLDVIRIRFTPGAGEVFGPPSATTAADPDAPEGSIRQYEIVPERNRILNGEAGWARFRPTNDLEQPEPADTFDGVLDTATGIGGQSWGVVDDTCDVVIEATVEIGSDRFIATARASAGPPDFAPDRRPFMSLADDLADRELPALTPAQIAEEETVEEVADLLRRVFETVSLTNLDALRRMTMSRQQANDPDPIPVTSLPGSMTGVDQPLADKIPSILGPRAPDTRLGYTEVAQDTHSEIADIDNMLNLFRTQAERIRHLLRPPFARIADLPEKPPDRLPTDELGLPPKPVLTPRERDPRVLRDGLHDMRMPPYMRDSDAAPLSLTWRQYREVMSLIDHLAAIDEDAFAQLSPVRRHVAQVVQRRRAAESEHSRARGTRR